MINYQCERFKLFSQLDCGDNFILLFLDWPDVDRDFAIIAVDRFGSLEVFKVRWTFFCNKIELKFHSVERICGTNCKSFNSYRKLFRVPELITRIVWKFHIDDLTLTQCLISMQRVVRVVGAERGKRIGASLHHRCCGMAASYKCSWHVLFRCRNVKHEMASTNPRNKYVCVGLTKQSGQQWRRVSSSRSAHTRCICQLTGDGIA